MKILIVEDDIRISDLIAKALAENGFSAEHAYDGENAYQIAMANRYDLLIVDLMLPKKNGLELITSLRENQKNVPVLILSAKRSVDDRILGLQKGGDDYLTKPFSIAELLARVQALVRRAGTQNHFLSYSDIKLNLVKREVLREGQQIELNSKEFTLLEYFLKNPEKILTKKMILEEVWKYDFDPQTNVVDVSVCRLRNKIDKGFSYSTIQTLRGIGYVLKKE